MEISNDKHKIKKEEILVNKHAKIPNVSAENKIMKKAKIQNEFQREIRKNKRKSRKSYLQSVKERMGEYQENKSIKKSIKLIKNNYGEIFAVENEKK